MEAHALAHTVYWTFSRGYFSATGRPVEKNSTGRPVEWFYWTSSRTDDLGHYDTSVVVLSVATLLHFWNVHCLVKFVARKTG